MKGRIKNGKILLRERVVFVLEHQCYTRQKTCLEEEREASVNSGTRTREPRVLGVTMQSSDCLLQQITFQNFGGGCLAQGSGRGPIASSRVDIASNSVEIVSAFINYR